MFRIWNQAIYIYVHYPDVWHHIPPLGVQNVLFQKHIDPTSLPEYNISQDNTLAMNIMKFKVINGKKNSENYKIC